MTAKHAFLIAGFRQPRGWYCGMLKLAKDLDDARIPDAKILGPIPWHADWAGYAEQFSKLHNGEESPQVFIFGYSYGGGWGAIRLALELRKRGIRVHRMILTDPVYRSPSLLGRIRAVIPPYRPRGRQKVHWLRLLLWDALWLAGRIVPGLCPRIRKPDNVADILVFRQRENLPMGHTIDGESSTYWSDVPHEQMDELPPFHAVCKRLLAAEAT